MDTRQRDRFDMFLKVRTFLVNNEEDLSVLALIATLQDELDEIIADIVEAEGEADEDISGVTDLKKLKQEAARSQGLKVAKAATLYYGVISYDPVLLKKVDLLKSELESMRHTKLYIRLKKLFKITDPVKALITAPDFAAADVTLLNTRNEEYFDVLEAPSDARSERSSYNKEVDRLLVDGIELLEKKLDVAVETFASSDQQLVDYYHSSRLIDDTGSRSELSGFDLETLTIPGSSSLSFKSTPSEDIMVYLKNNGPGQMAICVRATPSETCTVGEGTLVLDAGEEYLGLYSEMGIGTASGSVIITNLGTLQITLRAGTKEA